jgi:GNAT superfamily N-acetyltransferase
VNADLVRCLDLSRAVHLSDGYPPYLGSGLKKFIESAGNFGAWIAEESDQLVGHVALNPSSSREVMALACGALQRPAERLVVVARLLVAPAARRAGVGSALLEVATKEAFARDLWPVLDVATRFQGAVALYERLGWGRAGEVTVRLANDTLLREFVYVAPPP